MKLCISKESIFSMVRDLNETINNINEENCYDMVVKFFNITSTLEDYLSEISKLPLKGIELFGIKSLVRRWAEYRRSIFFQQIHNVGRKHSSINSTKPGEEITKDNVYFYYNDIGGGAHTVAQFEASTALFVQPRIRPRMVYFVEDYKNLFRTNWLK